MGKTAITIKDVAKACDVSASTVSRALNPETRDLLSTEAVEKILATAAKLGYSRNSFASGWKTRRSNTIGVVIPDLTNPVFPPIIRGIERRLDAAGYVTILADSEGSSRNAAKIIDNLQARQVDGLIVATATRHDTLLEQYMKQGLALVLVNRATDTNEQFAVINDDYLGIELALDHLIGLGHRSIAFIGGPRSTSTGHDRHAAFVALMRKRKLKSDRRLIVHGSAFAEQVGRQSCEKLLASGIPFTAIVAANDLLALGAIDTLKAHGLLCPEDISVTGFNNMPLVDRFDPPLTTIHIPHEELGVQAAELLLRRIRNPRLSPTVLKLKPCLILGKSTHTPPKRSAHGRGRISATSAPPSH